MFISNNNNIKVGDKVVSARQLETMSGTFTIGHEFTVLSIGERGYDLVDKNGNRCLETGWESVKKAG